VSYRNNFYAILGKYPSKGARSPKLWNAAFEVFRKKERMIAIDIKNKLTFKHLFKKLKSNELFRGGAITNPYKEIAYKILGKNIDEESRKAKSVNCLYRDNRNILRGANTDGIACLEVLKKNQKNLKHKKILLIGFGGAGKAIASSLDIFYKKDLYITTRTKKKTNDIVNKFKYQLINWDDLKNKIHLFDVIINCTSVGHNNKYVTPIQISLIKKLQNKLIFDIIYSPPETKLLNLAKKKNNIVNGLQMNLLQAVIAFSKATKLKNRIKILNIMKTVK